MEGFGSLGFGNMSSTARKRRSSTSRRPWNEPQPLSDFHDGSSFSSTPPSDNNANKVVESDEGSSSSSFQGSNQERHNGIGASRFTEGFLAPTNWKGTSNFGSMGTSTYLPGNENTVKVVKLKVGGVTRTIDTKSVSDAASGVGSSSSKSSHISDASLLRQRNQENSVARSVTSDKVNKSVVVPWKGLFGSGLSIGKADSLKNSVPNDDFPTKQTNTHQPLRKSKRISTRRVLDDELDDDDDDEIRYLEKVRTAKFTAAYDDDEEGRSQKHRKLSKVMKQDADGPRGFSAASARLVRRGKRKQRSSKLSDDTDYMDEEEEELISDCEPETKSTKSRKETTVTTRQRAMQTGKDASYGSLDEFPNGLPPAAPRRQKEKLSEVEQQLKKAEAAQRRRMQVEKAAKESEAEAIRKILGQDSSRKKREEKMKKRREEKAKEKAANSMALQSDTVRWVMGPSGTVVTFPDEVGLPTLFESKPHSYPPRREQCAGPSCTNPYKYRDSKSKLPLCSLRCYKALQEKTTPLSTCI